MAVDLLILTGDSGTEFLQDPSRVTKDVRAINHSLYEFHGFLGMRVLGPHKVAWAVRQHGYTCQVISKIQMISFEQLISISESFVNEKTVIGIGTSLITYISGDNTKETFLKKLSKQSLIYKFVKAIEYYKKKYNTKVIVGGSQAIAFSSILDHDYVIQGEAENKLPQLMDRIRRGGIQKKPYDWSITGCDFKWHQTDFIINKEPVPIETSRGCIFKCKFCAWDKIGKRAGTFERPLTCVRDQIEENYELYKTTHYWITDDTFNDSNDRVNEFCEMLESLPFRVNFMGYFRLDLLHRFQLTAKRLFKAGMVGCSFGIESFYPEAAKTIGKPFNAKHGKEFLDHFYYDICESNVMINCCNIVGLPGETEKHLNETMEWYIKRPHIHTNWSSLQVFDPKRISPEQITSVFDREATKYGYTFFQDKLPNYWERQNMTSVKAHELKNLIARNMKPHNINAGEPWLSMHYLSILNITPKEARKIGWQNIYLNKTELVRANHAQYFDLLKNYAKEIPRC